MSIPPHRGPPAKVPVRPPSKAPPQAPSKAPPSARSPSSPRDKRPITPRGTHVSPPMMKSYAYNDEHEQKDSVVSVVSSRRGELSPPPPRMNNRPTGYVSQQRERNEPQEELQFWSPPPAHAGTFDVHDRAPEDRFLPPQEEDTHPFGKYDCVVRGSLVIEGLNYAKFQAPMNTRNSENRKKFTTALRDDIIACVGQGVRRKDIMLRAAPGPIRGVVLEYDKYQEGSPTLVNADWGIEFEYAIKVRNEVSQQHVAMMLYTSLRDADGLDIDESRHAWIRYLDPSAAPTSIFTSPVDNDVY